MSPPSRSSSSSPSSPSLRAARPRLAAGSARAWAACAALIACVSVGVGVSPAHADPSPHATGGRSSGGTVHVCVDAQGLREFRDTPCAVHQRSLRAIAFERASPDAASQARGRDLSRAMARRNAAEDRAARVAGMRASAGRVPARPASAARKTADPCLRARMRRDEAHERASSTGVRFDQWRRLDREVWLRCPNG